MKNRLTQGYGPFAVHFYGMDRREIRRAQEMAKVLRREYSSDKKNSRKADYIDAAVLHARWIWWPPLREKYRQQADDALAGLTPIEKISVGLLNPDNLVISDMQSRYTTWMLLRKYPPLADRVLGWADDARCWVAGVPGRVRAWRNAFYWKRIWPVQRNAKTAFWRAYYRLSACL